MTMQIAKKTAPSRKRNNKGFSLIELIIVITIMAILTALLAPQLLRYVEQSRAAKDAVNLDEAYRAVQLAFTSEKVSAEVTSTTTLVYGNDGKLTGAGSELTTELNKTLGDISKLPAPVSKAYKDATLNIVITVAADKSISVSCTHPA